MVVSNLDTKARKITLHPAPPEDERDQKRVRKLAPYQQVEVVVTQIRDNGLGVRIVGATGRNARAYIHAGQTGTPRGTERPRGSSTRVRFAAVGRPIGSTPESSPRARYTVLLIDVSVGP